MVHTSLGRACERDVAINFGQKGGVEALTLSINLVRASPLISSNTRVILTALLQLSTQTYLASLRSRALMSLRKECFSETQRPVISYSGLILSSPHRVMNRLSRARPSLAATCNRRWYPQIISRGGGHRRVTHRSASRNPLRCGVTTALFKPTALPRRIAVSLSMNNIQCYVHIDKTLTEPENSSVYSRYPLDLNTDEIRLIEIQYDTWDKPIRCSMHVVSLQVLREQEQSIYRTLSYVWGEPGPRKTIFINGMAVSIQSNLFTALKHIRSVAPQWTGQNFVIWIDALCIDQSNVFERSHQVAMMAGIYRSSAETVAWLGKMGEHAPPNTELSEFDQIYGQSLSEPHQVGCQCQDAYWERVPELPWSVTPVETCAMALSILNRIRAIEKCEDFQLCRLFANREEMLAFHLFMKFLSNSPFLTRTWIVQEIVLAPDITICVGDVRFQWAILSEAATIFVQHTARSCCPLQIAKLARSVDTFGIVCTLDALHEVCHSDYVIDPFVFLCQFIGKKGNTGS